MPPLMLLRARPRAAVHSFLVCRHFGVSWWESVYRATRFLLTGSTGRYRIDAS